MNLQEHIFILQLAKDVFGGVCFFVSIFLVWSTAFDDKLILACGILALFVDIVFVAFHMIYKKFTFAHVKDFFSVLLLLIYVILTIFISSATKHRLVYCIIYALFASIDICCVVLHTSGLFLFYTERLYVEMHNSASEVLNIDNSVVSPY